MHSNGELPVDRSLQKTIRVTTRAAMGNLRWLREHMPPYFFVTVRDEDEALAGLATNLHSLRRNRHLILVEQEKELILAGLDVPGSIYETLERNQDREASYAEITHSDAPVPGAEHPLEIQRFEFDRKADAEVPAATDAAIPSRIRRETHAALKANYPPIAPQECEKLLRLIWLNQNANADYLKLAIHLTPVTNTTLAVLMAPLTPGQSPPPELPAVVPLLEWAALPGSVFRPTNTPPVIAGTTFDTPPGQFVDVDLRARWRVMHRLHRSVCCFPWPAALAARPLCCRTDLLQDLCPRPTSPVLPPSISPLAVPGRTRE